MRATIALDALPAYTAQCLEVHRIANTDGDGLSDYEEVKIYHTKPAKADSDDDSLSDYAEIYTYHTNPNKYSSDNNTLSDAMEVLVTHTNPWKDDTDNDALNDSTEYQNGLNPLSNDTDSDQWLDGVEYHYWLSHGCNSAEAYANCKNPDVDGDGITDYQEVNGYTVKVATSFDQNGNPIMQEKTMYGDPIQAYKQAGGAWTDTDGDGIPDIVEIYFSNTTNIDNNATWEHIIKSGYSWITNYQWCREYYWALNGSDASKAENWTQKAFNPFVVCNLPPMITTFSAEVHEYGEWYNKRYTIQTQFVVKDLRGVAEVNIELYELAAGNLYASHTYSPGAGYTVITAGWVFDVDYWTLKAYGYNVRGTVKGESGLSVSAEQKISGLVTMVVDAIMALGAMLLGGLQKVWEAVANAVNTIGEWIKEMINRMVSPLLEPIVRSADRWVHELNSAIEDGVKEYSETNKASSAVNRINSLLFGPLFLSIIAVATIIMVVLTMLLPVITILSILLTLAIYFITSIVLSTLGGNESHTLSLENLNPWMKPQDWIKYAEQIADPKTQQEKAYWAILSLLFSAGSFIMAALAAYLDKSGTVAAIMGIGIGTIAIILGLGAMAIGSYGLGVVAFVLSIGTIVLSLIGLAGANRASAILSGIGIVFGVVAAYCGYQAL